MDLNKVMIIGRLTAAPEIRTTPTGQNVANFSVATSRRWKDQSGADHEKTEFHNVVAWRKLADIIGQYLTKGSQAYIEGHLETRSWDGDDGKKRYRTEIIADNLIMLGRAGQGGQNAARPATNMTVDETQKSSPAPTPAPSPQQEAPKEEEISIEDIPF